MTDFLKLEFLKNSLSITTTNNDSKLLEILQDSNNEVDKILTPYAAIVPIDTGTDIFTYGTTLATIYARSRWLRDTGQLDRAKSSEEEYERKKESVIKVLQADRTTRTETVFIPGRNPTDTLYQPFETDEYITKIF